MSKKITVIGAGSVGSATAFALAMRNIANEIVIIDINEDRALGEAMDIHQGTPLLSEPVNVYAGNYEAAAGSDIVVIDQRVSGTGIQVASEIGGRTPLHATSQGKLLLSQLPDATVRYLMNGQGMDPFTPHTIVTLPDLLEELEHIRRKGCAIENGEYKIGLRSVSAPVFDREGQMRYTLTVVGLFRHVTSGEFEEAVDMVCAAAGSLSRELGYHA